MSILPRPKNKDIKQDISVTISHCSQEWIRCPVVRRRWSGAAQPGASCDGRFQCEVASVTKRNALVCVV